MLWKCVNKAIEWAKEMKPSHLAIELGWYRIGGARGRRERRWITRAVKFHGWSAFSKITTIRNGNYVNTRQQIENIKYKDCLDILPVQALGLIISQQNLLILINLIPLSVCLSVCLESRNLTCFNFSRNYINKIYNLYACYIATII